MVEFRNKTKFLLGGFNMGLKKWYKKDKKIIWASFAIGIIITTIFTGYSTKAYSESIHSGLEKNLIRFHVIANSDSEYDQSLKLKVRDSVLEQMKPLLDKSKSIDESRQIILENKEMIESTAQKLIYDSGNDYGVTVNLEKALFPTKKYGDIVLPSGEYEALRIVIGNGEGKNWWCVMFPPLCFVDITHGTVPEQNKQELQNVLTEEEYSIVATAKDEKSIPVKVKFKLVEWWQENKDREIQAIFAHK